MVKKVGMLRLKDYFKNCIGNFKGDYCIIYFNIVECFKIFVILLVIIC